MAEREALTADYVRSILDYNPETGEFRWKKRIDMTPQWNGRYAGKIAGCLSGGYVDIGINNILYKAHRLAWLLMTGEWPVADIDHKDLDGSNNRWLNIRSATRSQNNFNKIAQSNSKSGIKGVHFSKNRGKWLVQICVRRRRINIGYFKDIKDAENAYAAASIKFHGDFSRCR